MKETVTALQPSVQLASDRLCGRPEHVWWGSLTPAGQTETCSWSGVSRSQSSCQKMAQGPRVPPAGRPKDLRWKASPALIIRLSVQKQHFGAGFIINKKLSTVRPLTEVCVNNQKAKLWVRCPQASDEVPKLSAPPLVALLAWIGLNKQTVAVSQQHF